MRGGRALRNGQHEPSTSPVNLTGCHQGTPSTAEQVGVDRKVEEVIRGPDERRVREAGLPLYAGPLGTGAEAIPRRGRMACFFVVALSLNLYDGYTYCILLPFG